MDATARLDHARSALGRTAGRITEILHQQPDLGTPIPGSEWTVREAAVHLITGTTLYVEIATGTPSPITSLARADIAAGNTERIADLPESDPAKVCELLAEAVGRFLDVTADKSGQAPVTFHCGIAIGQADMAAVLLGEMLLHGFDIATATATLWPVDARDAALVLAAYLPLFGEILDRQAAATVDLAWKLDLSGVGKVVIRVAHGTYSVAECGTGPVHCDVVVDPVTHLLVATGRLDPITAITLGLVRAGGARPKLAPTLYRLFPTP